MKYKLVHLHEMVDATKYTKTPERFASELVRKILNEDPQIGYLFEGDNDDLIDSAFSQ